MKRLFTKVKKNKGLNLILVLLIAAEFSGCTGSRPVQVQPPPQPAIPLRPPVGTDDPRQPIDASNDGIGIEVEPVNDFKEKEIDLSLPTMEYITDRIAEYGNKLKRWQELDRRSVGRDMTSEESEKMTRCFREIQKLSTAYSNLRRDMGKGFNDEIKRMIHSKVFELQRDDIAFMENECGVLLVEEHSEGTSWDKRGKSSDLAAIESLIDQHTNDGAYEEVVQAWMQIARDQLERVEIRTKVKYGNALMYLHQESKAAEVYREVVEVMTNSNEQALDLVSLRRVLADLYTASGNYRAAREQYKKITEEYQTLGRLDEWGKQQLTILDQAATGSPELSSYSALLRNFLGFIPQKDGYNVVWQAKRFLTEYPYSSVTNNIDFIHKVSTRMADEWFNGELAAVDELKGEEKFQQAIDLIDAIPTDIISGEQQMRLAEKKDEILLSSAVNKETERLEDIQAEQGKWNDALLLARDGNYDEAITLFESLRGGSLSGKASEKISQLRLEAAKDARSRAAQMYIRSSKTTNISTKKQLLLETRALLQGILEKYPNVEIAGKVRDNLIRVEETISGIDPQLLLNDKTNALTDVDGIDNAFAQPVLGQSPTVDESKTNNLSASPEGQETEELSPPILDIE